MSDDVLRDMLAKLKPGMSQAEVFATLLDDTLAREGQEAAAAFLVCAVPHWFDAPLMAALLDKPEAEADSLLQRVISYSFVSQRPDGAYLYHENARAYLLARVKQDRARFRELSHRAAIFFQNQLKRAAEQEQNEQTAEFTFELIFHLLVTWSLSLATN
jgi:hypothetical protein